MVCTQIFIAGNILQSENIYPIHHGQLLEGLRRLWQGINHLRSCGWEENREHLRAWIL
jgi:hypothetical protein